MSNEPPLRLYRDPVPPPLPQQQAAPPQVVYYPVYVQEEKKKTGWLAWVVGACFAVLVVAISISTMETPQEKHDSGVRGTAVEIVKSRLKDGKGAKFDLSSISWKTRKDGDVHVWGDVRASNSFGAMLNQQWQVVMSETEDQKWQVLWVKIGDVPEGNYLPDVAPAPAE